MQLYILDQDGITKGTLTSDAQTLLATPFFDDEYVQDLETGAETFTFSTLTKSPQARNLTVGNYVAFQHKKEYKLFQVTEVSDEHGEDFVTTAYCEMAGIELINEVLRPRTFASVNVRQFMTSALEDTGWLVGFIDSRIVEVYTIELEDYGSVYSTIQKHISETFGGELAFRVEYSKGKIVGKYVDVHYERGAFSGFRFSYDKNMDSVKRSVDSSELVTALIGVGNDGITFKEASASDKPLNQDWIGDEDAYKQWNKNGNHIFGIFEADTSSPVELLKLTREELVRRITPKFTYELGVQLLGQDIADIGDTVYVIDNDFTPAIHLSARVNQLKLSFTDPSSNECVLANFKEVKSKITDEMRKIASLIDSKFPIGSESIQDGAVTGDKVAQGALTGDHIQPDTLIADHIKAEQIQTKHLEAESVTSDKIKANEIETKHLKAKSVTTEILQAGSVVSDTIATKAITTEHLSAESVESENIKAGAIDTIHLQAESVSATNIQAGAVTATHIKSQSIDTTHLKANIITSDILQSNAILARHISAGAIGTTQLQAGSVTGEKMVIADAFIKNAMIESISASKLTAGEIDTSKITIKSPSGNIIIADSTQQFRDAEGNVRVQIGEDETGQFNFLVLDEAGTGVIIDSDGIKERAIADGLIKNKMIGNKEIDGTKVNVNSLVSTINNEGTTSLKGSKVVLDTVGQSLEVAFNEMKTKTNATEDSLETLTTDFEMEQGRITTAIENTKVVKDGQTLLLKDEHTKLEQTVNGISTKVGGMETTISNTSKKVTDVESELNVQKGLIESSVTRDEFEALEIGGKNILRKTSKDFKSVTFAGWDNYLYTLQFADYDLKAGDMLTARIYLKPTAQEAKVHLDFRNASGSQYRQYFGNVIAGGQEGYSELTVEIPATAGNGEAITKVQLSIRHSAGTTPSDTVQYKEPKLEKGTIASDWTPAPEDIEEALASLEIGARNLARNSSFAKGALGWSTYSSGAVLAIEDDTNSPSGKVAHVKGFGGYWYPYQSLTVPLENGKNYTVSVTAKGSGNLRFGWEGQVKLVTLTSEYKVYSYTFTWNGNNKNFSFYGENASADVYYHSIKIEAGDKATGYTPALEDVQEAITGINVGGTNIARHTDFTIDGVVDKWIGWGSNSNASKIANLTLTSGEAMSFLEVRSVTGGLTAGTEFGLVNKAVSGEYFSTVADKEYTISFLVAVHPNANMDMGFTYLINDGGTNQRIEITDVTKGELYGSFTSPFALNVYKYSLTFKAKYTHSAVRLLIGNKVSKDLTTTNHGLMYVAKLKLEEGNRATSYSPSPEDLKTRISSAETRISQTERDISFTAKQATVDTINSSLGSVTNRVTATESRLNIAEGKIEGTVSKTELTRLQNAGNNLVLDSGFEETDVWGSKLTTEKYLTGKKSLKVVANGGIQDIYLNSTKTSEGRVYYTEVWVLAGQATWSGGVALQASLLNSTTNVLSYPSVQYLPANGGQTWTKLSGYITIPKGYDLLRVRLSVRNDATNGAVFYFDDALVVDVTDSKLSADELSGKISAHETRITQTEKDITSKVSETDFNGNMIASLINQTATTVTISAQKLNLNGMLNISTFDSATQAKVNNGNTAKATLDSKASTWDSAKTTADTAKSTADTANSVANTAKSTADTAKSTADTAKNTATTASTTANTANNTANTAKSTADTANGTANTLKGIVTNFDASLINTNPIFLDWTQTLPAGYSSFSTNGGSTMSKVTSGNGMGNAVKINAPAGSTSAFLTPTQVTDKPFAQYMTVEATFMLESGAIDGAGILLRYNTGSTYTDTKFHFKDVLSTPIAGKWYTVSQVFKFSTATQPTGFTGYQIYPMASWNGFVSAPSAKVMQFDSVKVRPATDQEIKAVEANSDTARWKSTNSTTINGAMIETGSITVDKIKAGTIDTASIKIRGGSSTVYTLIDGANFESAGTFTRTWQGATKTHNIKMRFENGYLRARNDTEQRSLYFSDFGISTYADGVGNDDASGTIEFFSTKYSTAKGITIQSTYGVVALRSEQNRIVLEANATVHLESEVASVFIRPFKNTRNGNNVFNFWIKENDDVGATDGVLYYGSDINGYGSGLRFSKSSVGGAKIYATDGNGGMGSGHFVAETFRGALMTESTNAYIMVDDAMRVTSKAGYNGGNPSYRDIQARDIQANSIRLLDTSGSSDFYIGVSGNELRVTNNLFWNNGSTTYRPIRADNFYGGGSSNTLFQSPQSAILESKTNEVYARSNNELRVTKPDTYSTYVPVRASAFNTGSKEEYKQDIVKHTDSALEVINASTIYDYRLRAEVADGKNKMRMGLVIGEGYNTPKAVIDGDGVEQYTMNSLSWVAIQELSKENTALKVENDALNRRLEVIEKYLFQKDEV